MKPSTISTIQPIEDTQIIKCIGEDFNPHLEDLNEDYIKENIGIENETISK